MPKESLQYSHLYPLLVDSNNNIYFNFYDFDYVTQSNKSIGLVSFDGTNWTKFNEFDSPFNIDDDIHLSNMIDEALNGDIWMGINGKLVRYRYSLGGYP